MNVVLVHPIHGAKVAINELEMEQDEKDGWVRYNPDPLVENPIDETRVTHKSSRKVNQQLPGHLPKVPSFLTSAVDDHKEG